MTVSVTHHAIDRYIERIAPVGRDEAARAILAAETAIHAATAFGAHVVRLGNGARLVCTGPLSNVRVVTVLARGQIALRHLAGDLQ